ncbi:MAG: KAP family NTPase [Planctomycetes bacterium]|nr:KAP family NTPase [Planctomycetota bacterium]
MSIASDSISKDPNDKFGRGPFADVVAKILKSLPENESTVVGLFGGWGSGKSHLLQMIRNLLNDDESTYVIEFNPWAHDTHWQLLEALFRSIEARLSLNSKSGGKTNKNIKKLSGALKKYGRQLAQNAKLSIGVPILGVNLSSETTAPTFKHRHIQGAKEGLEKVLKDCQFKIVIEIDDLDRMEKSRICAFFKLMNLTLGMPNINFLVAADYEVVKEAISSEYGESAGPEPALDKFIQVPVHLPPPPDIDLWLYTWELIKKVLRTADIRYTEEDLRVVYDGLKRSFELFITTPRQSIRLANALLVPLMTTGQDVDAFDLVHIEGIRLLLPKVYSLIKGERSAFLGNVCSLSLTKDEQKDVLGAGLKESIDALTPDQQFRIKGLLKFIFPNMQIEERLTDAFYNKLKSWKKDAKYDKRVSSRAYVQEFFSYAPGTRGVRESEIYLFFEAAKEGYQNALGLFKQFVTPDNQPAFLETLARQIKNELDSALQINVVRILTEQFSTEDFGQEMYWTWAAAIMAALQSLDSIGERKKAATEVIERQRRVDSKISILNQLTKKQNDLGPVIESSKWIQDCTSKVIGFCQRFILKALETEKYYKPQLRFGLEFMVSKGSGNQVDGCRSHILNDRIKLEALLDAYRRRWPDDIVRYSSASDIREIGDAIGGGDRIVSTVLKHRISVTQPSEQQIQTSDFESAIQNYLVVSGLGSKVWGEKSLVVEQLFGQSDTVPKD